MWAGGMAGLPSHVGGWHGDTSSGRHEGRSGVERGKHSSAKADVSAAVPAAA